MSIYFAQRAYAKQPMALITLDDTYRHFFKSNKGEATMSIYFAQRAYAKQPMALITLDDTYRHFFKSNKGEANCLRPIL